MRQRVEQVLQREVRMLARGRLPVRDREHDFQSWAEHIRTTRFARVQFLRLLRLHRREERKSI